MERTEIEVRFLEINAAGLKAKLADLGAVDGGETLLDEMIFYDDALAWKTQKRFVRLRRADGVTMATHKQYPQDADGMPQEIEFGVSDLETAALFLERIGLRLFRHQQKYRHTLRLGDVHFDFDTWPQIPTYVEVEGPSIAAIRLAAEGAGLCWADAVTLDPKDIIEVRYRIPVGDMHWFTFDRFE